MDSYKSKTKGKKGNRFFNPLNPVSVNEHALRVQKY